MTQRPVPLDELRKQFGIVNNANMIHKDSLSLQEKLALKITHSLGTMICVYLFAVIGVMSLIGALTGNAFLTLSFGALSSYFLQLVLLPLIMVGQNLEGKHSEARAQTDFDTNVKAEAEVETILLHLENQGKLMLQILEKLENKPIA